MVAYCGAGLERSFFTWLYSGRFSFEKEGILLHYVLIDVMLLGVLWFSLPAAGAIRLLQVNESQNAVIIT